MFQNVGACKEELWFFSLLRYREHIPDYMTSILETAVVVVVVVVVVGDRMTHRDTSASVQCKVAMSIYRHVCCVPRANC